MKYYLKPHVTDKMLKAVGFEIISNLWGYKWAVRNPFSDGDELTIVLHKFDDDYQQIIGFPYGKDITPIIQDLTEKGYVEVRK